MPPARLVGFLAGSHGIALFWEGGVCCCLSLLTRRRVHSASSPTTYSGEVRAHNDLTNPHVATHWACLFSRRPSPGELFSLQPCPVWVCRLGAGRPPPGGPETRPVWEGSELRAPKNPCNSVYPLPKAAEADSYHPGGLDSTLIFSLLGRPEVPNQGFRGESFPGSSSFWHFLAYKHWCVTPIATSSSWPSSVCLVRTPLANGFLGPIGITPDAAKRFPRRLSPLLLPPPAADEVPVVPEPHQHLMV